MRINIEGWNGYMHSYSIVAETICKGLLQFSDHELFFTQNTDVPESWQKKRPSLFDNMHPPSGKVDITLRIIFPYIFTPDENAKYTIVFVTSEFNYITTVVDPHDLCENVFILTPSEYSKRGIINSKFPPEKIFVVPHSCDIIKVQLSKNQLRKKYNISENDFVYFHCSAMTANKNVTSLIVAFEFIFRCKKNVTLLLKGVDNIFGSSNMLTEMIQRIESQIGISCTSKIIYIGNEISTEALAELYELSDCYVSPFFAEGFNIPVLEALCHNLQVICTSGGPPNEFAKDALFIKSGVKELYEDMNMDGNHCKKYILYPSVSNLCELMILVTVSHKNNDVEYYKQNFSHDAVGKKIMSLFNKITSHHVTNRMIVLRHIPVTKRIIENLDLFCGNTKYIIITDNIAETKKIYEDLDDKIILIHNDSLNDSYIEHLMKTLDLQQIIYIHSTDVLFLCDPRAYVYEHQIISNTEIFMNDKKIMSVICSNNFPQNKIINVTHHKLSESDFSIETEAYSSAKTKSPIQYEKESLNKKYKWIVKRSHCKLLYTLDDEKKMYHKVYFIENDINVNPTKLLIQVDKQTPLEEILSKVEIAIIMSTDAEKYSSTIRAAPLTLMFDIGLTSYQKLTKQKIFVYPEAFEYFFKCLYSIMDTQFTLYAICDSITKDRCKELDTKNLIKDVIFSRKNE